MTIGWRGRTPCAAHSATTARRLWLQFSAQSVKHDADAAEKVWSDATKAELAGQLRAGAGTIITVAKQEGWTPPPPPGLPAYFDGGEEDVDQASADLRLAVVQWVEQGLAYKGRGEAPRDAIAGAVGLGKSTVTLEVLAQMAQGVTVHYYAPTLELGAEVVAKAKALGLDAVLIRGREAQQEGPGALARAVRQRGCGRHPGPHRAECVGVRCAARIDDLGNVTTCEYFDGCPYVQQFDALEGKLVVLAHERLTLPKDADRQTVPGRGRRALPHHPDPAAIAAARAGDRRSGRIGTARWTRRRHRGRT